MGAVATQLQATRSSRVWFSKEWLSFLLQVLLVASVEVADDLIRGMVAEHDSSTGILNADRVARFEAAHGLWWEPGWQQFFRRGPGALGMHLGWAQTETGVNAIYTVGHVGVTFAFATWLFVFRRSLFAFVRNIFFISNALAIVLYETFPMAPPRLTPNLTYQGHPYRFVDTLYQLLGADGKVQGTKLGYNEFAAMPSVHMAWALIVGLTLAWVLRPAALRLAALCWLPLMLVAVVVTGNHYLMDAVGAAGVLVPALGGALAILWWREGHRSLGGALTMLRGLRYGQCNQQPGVSPAPAEQTAWRKAA